MADNDTLKQKNIVWLGVYLAFFGLGFAWIFLGRPVAIEALKALNGLDWTKAAVTVGGTLAVMLLNGLATANFKATLVFWAISHPLPGARFVKLVRKDGRVDMDRFNETLGRTLPNTPAEQNSAWYNLYKKNETDPSVRAGHQDYLLFRDLTWLTVLLFFAGSSGIYLYTDGGRPATIYMLVSAMLYFLLGIAARIAGNRFVVTVVACEMAKVESSTPRILI